MSFQLTADFIFNLLNEAATGNPGPLTEALDPEVRWRIGSETKDDVAKTGVYVSLPRLPRGPIHFTCTAKPRSS